jgi:hypothetical protein
MGYGAPHAADPPRTRPVSPSRAPGFHRRLGRSKPPYALRLLPTAHPRSHRPCCHRSGRTGREVPPLGRGTCPFPPSLRPGRPLALSPYEVPELGVLQARPGFHGPQAGGSEQGGGRTLPVTGLAIVRPRFGFPGRRGLQSPSAPWRLATPSAPACSAHVMGLWVHPIPWPGLAPGFPRPVLGVGPPGPFPGRPTCRFPLLPKGMRIAVEPGAVPPERRVECGASQDVPPAPRFPGVRRRSGSS